MHSKLRVAVDGGDYSFDKSPKNGIQRWLSCYIKGAEQKIDYYYFGDRLQKKSNSLVKAIRLPQRAYAKIFLPFNILKNKDTVFLGFSGYLPSLIKLFGVKSVIFIHDFGFYKYPEKYKNAQKLISQTKFAIDYADKIVVFTKYIRDELLQRFPQAKNKLEQLYGGFDHLPKSNNEKTGFKYFLYVGVIKPTKNILHLIEIYGRLCQENITCPKLLIIGRAEQSYLNQIKINPVYRKLRQMIIFKGEVNDQELVNYYDQAEALINIADDEGLCFPVGEALTAGIPVITNDLKLYQEYLPYFSNLKICRNDEEILIAMQRPRRKISNTKTNPFTWANFSSNLNKLVKSI